MRAIILVAYLSACWTGYTEPKSPPVAKKQKVVLSPDCQETIEWLWRAIEDPPESFPEGCRGDWDQDPADYWYCVASRYEERASLLGWAAWYVVGACPLE